MLRAPRSRPGPRLPSPTDNAPRVPRSAGCAESPDRMPPPDNDSGKPSILFRAYEVSQPRVVGDPLPNPGLGGGEKADGGTRTPNLLITNQLLYRLSYVSTPAALRSRNVGSPRPGG